MDALGKLHAKITWVREWLNFSGFAFCQWYWSFIVPSLPILPLSIIFAYFFQPEKSTFFCGSTGIFTCLLTNDRSQSLTKLLFSHGFFINSTQQRWRKNPRSLSTDSNRWLGKLHLKLPGWENDWTFRVLLFANDIDHSSYHHYRLLPSPLFSCIFPTRKINFLLW